MTRPSLVLSLALFTASAALAQPSPQNQLFAMQPDVAALIEAQEAVYDYREADTTLQIAFDQSGVGWARRYTEAWGNNGLYPLWDDAKPLYTRLRSSLGTWAVAAGGGRVSGASATAHAEAAMQIVRALDEEVGALLANAVDAYTSRALWLDAAHGIPVSDPQHQATLERAERPLERIGQVRAALREIGRMTLLPLPPESAPTDPDPLLLVAEMARSENPAVRRAAARILARLVAGTEGDPDGEAAALLLALAERDALRDDAVWQAVVNGDGTGAADAQILGDGVLDRAAHLIPPDVSALEGPDLERMTDIAKYAAVLVDDLHNPSPLSRPSAAQRFLSRLHGAVALADGIDEADGRTLVDGLRDLTTGRTSVDGGRLLGPFDIPAEVAAAQIGVTREGVLVSADAMLGVRDAIGGDPSGLNRARNAARRLEQVLSAANYVGAMTDALTSRLADRVPIVRSLVNWFAGRG